MNATTFGDRRQGEPEFVIPRLLALDVLWSAEPKLSDPLGDFEWPSFGEEVLNKAETTTEKDKQAIEKCVYLGKERDGLLWERSWVV